MCPLPFLVYKERWVIFIAVKKKAVAKVKVEKRRYTCLCCGVEKIEDQFFQSRWSNIWTYSDKKVLVCKECIAKRFSELSRRYESDKTALLLCCYVLDVPFYATLYESITENNSIFSVGLYLRQLQLGQYQTKTFLNTLVSDELFKTDRDVKDEVEAKWSKSDKQNMNFAINIVGYDPFDDCGMTQTDRKYCFNILAGYCDSEGIQDDGHKIQSVVQITQSQLQCRKIDEFINAELLSVRPDESRVKHLTDTKKQLLDSIAKIAKDNNLSSAYNKNSTAGINTLSNKMKEMLQIGFDNVDVNLFDIKTCAAMKQIADLSNSSIMDQLTFDSGDYTGMIKEQREMIIKYEDENLEIKEENRILKNKLLDLEQKKKR